jgi:hypothetical protein
MIACDLCRSELERADEQNLTLWTVFKKLGFRISMIVEAVPRPDKMIRHICQKCRFKIVEQMIAKPLSEPPKIAQKKIVEKPKEKTGK